MELTSHPSKVTLTQLQRFQPLPFPQVKPSLPEDALRHLASPSFNNLSIKDQSRIRKSYQLAYRSTFTLADCITHIHSFTNHLFTEQSLKQALTNSASKQGLIDWYLFCRTVSGRSKKHATFAQQTATAFIQKLFRIYRSKTKQWRAYEEVQLIRKTMEEKLLKEFVKQAKRQLLEHFERNRLATEKILFQKEMLSQLSYLQFDSLINEKLECGFQVKKVQYLFHAFEKRKGFVDLQAFRRQMFPEKKVVIERNGSFLKKQQLLTFVCKSMIQIYYSWQEMVEDYKHYQSEQDEEIRVEALFKFLSTKCQNKLSWIQVTHIKEILQFTCNIKYLYSKKDTNQLKAQGEKMAGKRAKKIKLKQQNPNFYSFRTIILLLLARCQTNKISRQQFSHFVVKHDPSLKYDAFYAVWRVYGDLINVQRMKQESGLPILACHLLLAMSPSSYEIKVEELLQLFPVNTDIPYSKVEESINLNCDFVLQNLHLRPLPYGDNDIVDYRTAIQQILPLDFEIKIRSYIFRKVSEKFIVLWRSIRAKRERERVIRQVFLLSKDQKKEPNKDEKVKSKEQKSSKKQEKLAKRSNNSSAFSKTSPLKTRKISCQIASQSEKIVRELLQQVCDTINPREKSDEQESAAYKKEIVLSSNQKYSFRSALTRIDFHWLLGTIAYSRYFLALRDNRLQQLNLKIPFRPGITPIDFAVWNNELAVLTSLSSLEIYSLGQSEVYPQRTIQLSKSQISQIMYDLIIGERLHRHLPQLMKAEGSKLFVSVLHSEQLHIIDQDPTIQTLFIKFDFKDHFLPKIVQTILKAFTSQTFQTKLAFLIKSKEIVSTLKASETFFEVKTGLEPFAEQFSAFQWKQYFTCVKELGPIAHCVLQFELGLKQPIALSAEVSSLLKLVRQHMRERNFSVYDILQQMNCTQQGITSNQVKRYMGRVAGFQAIGSATEGWLKGLSIGKKITYQQLASIISSQWPYSPIQKPLLLPSSFSLIPNLPLLIYTLQGSFKIYLRNTQDNKLVAILSAHSVTPLICLLPEQLLLLSSQPNYQRGSSQQILIWRLQQDIFGKFTQHPPWNVFPFMKVVTGHEAPISSIAYSHQSNSLVTSSLDGSIKFWEVIGPPLGFNEIKKIYAEGSHYINVAIYRAMVGKQDVFAEVIVSVRVADQISYSNSLPFQVIVETNLLELMMAKVPEKVAILPAPTRLLQRLGEEGERKGTRKKMLMKKWQREEIEKINKGLLALKSLDLNFYVAIKACFIFGNRHQLKGLSSFLVGKKYAQMIISKVREQYGLQLLEDLPTESVLISSPPRMENNKDAKQNHQLYLWEDSVQDIYQQLKQKGDSLGQLIDQETLLSIVRPHLYGENQIKFKEILSYLNHLRSTNSNSNKKQYNIQNLKSVIKAEPLLNAQQKFLSVLRVLNRKLKRSKVSPWQLFAISFDQLSLSKKIRVSQFKKKISSLGLISEQTQIVFSYLQHNGIVNLYEFIHFLKQAQEQTNDFLPNYSSLLLGQSLVLQIQDESSMKNDSQPQIQKPMERSLHLQVKAMLEKKQSRIASEASSLHGSSPKKEDQLAFSQLRHSTSLGSLSRQGKDQIERKARQIVKKLLELLRNQSKSLWEVVGVACQNFVREPLISDGEYFNIFEYLRTPLRLSDKLQLLHYLKRQGGGRCDLNALFEIQDPSFKRKVQGDKQLLLHLLDTLENNYSSILDEALEMAFFSNSSDIDTESFICILGLQPFNCAKLALNQWELLLKEEKLPALNPVELRSLLESLVAKHRLNIQFNRLELIGELLLRVYHKEQMLVNILPRTQKVTLEYLKKCMPQVKSLEEDFKSISYSLGKGKLGLKAQLGWEETIKELQSRMKKAREEESLENEAVRKLAKALEARKMSPFQFFISIDRNKHFVLSQQQLQVGLVELGITYDLWLDIPKKRPKYLTYYSFLSYLLSKKVLSYKSIDSQLQIAMGRFLKRFIRNDDIELVFKRLGANESEVNYKKFQEGVRRAGMSQDETKILFGMLVNERVVRGRRWGNDDAINDPSNMLRTFNFKQFAEVILVFRSENLTKAAAFRFLDYFKKRSISLFFQFKKWLDGNRKLKEVAEALKKNVQTLPKETFMLFLIQLHTPLSENELKDLLSKYTEEVDFSAFISHLEDVYKRATARADKEEVECYIAEMVKKMNELSVSLSRLFKDFSDDKGKMGLAQLSKLNQWLGTGLTKVQLRKIMTVLDTEKEGRLRAQVLGEAVEHAEQTLQKHEQDFRFEYIIEKLMNNPTKYVLKKSKLAFTLSRAVIIFESLLTSEQTSLLLDEALKQTKKSVLTQQQMQEYVQGKIDSMKRHCNKKDKETAMRLLGLLKKVGLQLDQAFTYLSKHTNKEALSKQQFMVLYQSLELKSDLTQIGSLFQFLDQKASSIVTKNKWEEKLSMIRLELEEQLSVNAEQLRLFYKVKLFLTDTYLLFVRKNYKSAQIYHFFDKHSSGSISLDQFLHCLEQLGCPAEETLIPKLMNYLDPNRTQKIQINFLLQQLEHCMSTKMRQVVATRTSLLFRQKSKVFGQQSQQFIQELAKKEELVISSNGQTAQSTIPENAFVDLLKEFGCSLTEEQVQDIRRNFEGGGEGQLMLYPIYHAFTSLFEASECATQHRKLYHKLMVAMIKTGCTLTDLSGATTVQHLSSFIEQLGIFTVVETKLMVNENVFPNSRVIDFSSLKDKLRNAYLTDEDELINSSLLRTSEIEKTGSWLDTKIAKTDLAKLIDVNRLRQAIGNNRSRVSLNKFEDILWECGVWVTKRTAKSYFNYFSEGDLLDVRKLIEMCSMTYPEKTEGLQPVQSRALSESSCSSIKSDYTSLLAEKAVMRVAQHIIKSLNFKGVSLEDQLNCYFSPNYGFIALNHLRLFFAQIGLIEEDKEAKEVNEGKKEAKEQKEEVEEKDKTDQNQKNHKKSDITEFLQYYSLHFHHHPFQPGQLIQLHKLEQILNIANQVCQLEKKSSSKPYQLKSVELEEWIRGLFKGEDKDNEEGLNFRQKMEGWLSENSIASYSLESLFKYFYQTSQDKRHLLTLFIKLIPSQIYSFQQFYEWLQTKSSQVYQPAKTSQSFLGNKSMRVSKKQKKIPQTAHQLLDQLLKRDPIKTYYKSLNRLVGLTLPENQCNLTRISCSLLLHSLHNQMKLISLTLKLISPPLSSILPSFNFTSSTQYQLKNLSIPIDHERALDQTALLLANNKWFAFPIERKYEFQSMASLAHILHPSSLFLRSRNLYLWDQTQPYLPKNALNYRWSMIPILASRLLNQLIKVQSAGYCLPHLRWNQLSKERLIDIPIYPCPIDRMGKVKLKVGEGSLNFEDPYCPPQFYRDEQEITVKCDSWIFGCILYQFIYGHPPQALLPQLKKFVEDREAFNLSERSREQTKSEHSSKSIENIPSLAQTLSMQELPFEFEYNYYNSRQIEKLLSVEHYHSASISLFNLKQLIKREQSIGALTFPLQLLYRQQLPHYLSQFKLMDELNHAIWQCLSLNPNQRPSLQQLAQRPCFKMGETDQSINFSSDMSNYLQVLSNHKNSLQFYQKCIAPVLKAVSGQNNNLEQVCLKCLAELNTRQADLLDNKPVSEKLAIPKQFPWPEKTEGPYSRQILLHKISIQSSSNLSILALLFQSNFLSLALLIAMNNSLLQEQILKLISSLLPSLKDYNSPCCAFIGQIIDCLLRILYESSKGFLAHEGQNVEECPPILNSGLRRAVQLSKRKQYFNKKKFSSSLSLTATTQQRSLGLLKQIILLTGQGNPSYPPVAHYLQEHQSFTQLLSLVFNHASLLSNNQPDIQIRYFTDMLSDPTKIVLQKQCRVEIDIMGFLSNRDQNKLLALVYVKNLLASSSTCPPDIFKFPPLFLHFATILRDPVEDVKVKEIVLEILELCLNCNLPQKILFSASGNALQECIRLMIQPPRQTQMHDQFMQLQEKLKEIGRLILQNKSLLEAISWSNESAESVLTRILDQNDSIDLPLRSYVSLQ